MTNVIFLVLVCLLVGALTEPPVDRRYLPPGQLQVENLSKLQGGSAAPSSQHRSPATSDSTDLKTVQQSTQYSVPSLSFSPGASMASGRLSMPSRSSSENDAPSLANVKSSLPDAILKGRNFVDVAPAKQQSVSTGYQRTAPAISDQYRLPASSPLGRTALSNQYGPPTLPQRLNTPPTNQYSTSSSFKNVANAPSNQYESYVSLQRLNSAPSTQYGPPALSQKLNAAPDIIYSAPISSKNGGNALPNQYEPSASLQRLNSAPSTQYGPPALSQKLNAAPDITFSAPISSKNGGNTLPNQYEPSVSLQRLNSAPSTQYGPPALSQKLNAAPANTYSAPISSQNGGNALGNQYEPSVSSQRLNSAPSAQYGPPALSQKLNTAPANTYSAPISSQNFAKIPSNNNNNGGVFATQVSTSTPTNRFAVPFSHQRLGLAPKQNSAPSIVKSLTEVPSSQQSGPASNNHLNVDSSKANGAPTTQYTTPYDASASARHENPSAKLEIVEDVSGGQEGSQSDNLNYEFAYEVQAYEFGNEFGHRESRHGDSAQGEYHVVLPDGRRQIVEYQADLQGYRPVIRYEESGAGATRENLVADPSAQGPY